MSISARMTIHQHQAMPLPRGIFGSFLEHMGRAVYEGVYQPGQASADHRGFRTDVMKLTKELGVTNVRYPGGNFVSFADWKDGIGPKEGRPVRPDFAWKSIETNQFGTDDFAEWCSDLGIEPMMAVNLGTGTPKEACELVEFCNMPRGTYWADQRRHDDPYAIKLWCLGNEMDGPWQAGQVPARDYALKARAASKLMKGIDGTIRTVLSGSSGYEMPTYMEWDREILETCFHDVDMIACHRYSNNHPDDTAWFLAEGTIIEAMIEDYRSLCRYVAGLKKSSKQIKLSYDEWNVWYKDMTMDGQWTKAPHLIEEVYNLEDALVVGQYLNAFIRNGDFVEYACLAQLVNIIGPMLTNDSGVLVQSIYYPFQALSRMTQGAHLSRSYVDVETYSAGKRKDVPLIDTSSWWTDTGFGVSIVNRSLDSAVEVEVDDIRYRGSEAQLRIVDSFALSGSDPKLSNTWENPHAIQPSTEVKAVWRSGKLVIEVPPLGMVAVNLSV